MDKTPQSLLLLALPILSCAEKDADSGDITTHACQSADDELRVTGEFRMADYGVAIDERYGAGLTLYLEHKIDIDTHEAGCVGGGSVQIEQAGLGCAFNVDFVAADGGFEITSLSFTADSYCPDFDDAIEGSYLLAERGLMSVSGLPSSVAMATGTEATVCVDDADFRISGDGSLRFQDDGTEHDFNFALDFGGDFWSTGSTSTDCNAGGDADAD